MASPPPPPSVVPAQLGFLTIYNPSLGITDDTIDDQIVYYASVNTLEGNGRRRRRAKTRPMADVSQEERNKRLRQIGLAQGIVEFGRSFSGDRPVDTVDTEKSRVVLHELEPGWWIVASVDLTRLQTLPSKGKAPATGSGSGPGSAGQTEPDNVEYSSREVKPAALLLQDLLRAHAVFLLHQDSSLSALFVRTKRAKFIGLLARYWDTFLSTWNVMLHGNPIANVFGGIKVAASGELGIGVGEEERGSGEREVLEGLVGRIEGLADLIVSKFGPYDPDEMPEAGPTSVPANPGSRNQWLGTGAEPDPEDGAVFLGVGAISRRSLRDVTCWMEDMYSWGEYAYGVRDSPSSTRRARARRPSASADKENVLLPPTPVTELARRAKQQSKPDQVKSQKQGQATSAHQSHRLPVENDPESAGTNHFVDILKLGYGKYWSISGSTAAGSEAPLDAPPTGRRSRSVSAADATGPGRRSRSVSLADGTGPGRRSRRGSLAGLEHSGHYLIGLLGDVEEQSDEDSTTTTDQEDRNSRTMLRTVTVELESRGGLPESQMVRDLSTGDTGETPPESSDADRPKASSAGDRQPLFDSRDRNKSEKLRVVVYVNKPFMFTFLFRLRTDSLALDGLYKSLHHQLAPLRKPLGNSTSYRPGKPDVGRATAAANVYDLVWDSKSLTIHSTIPSIPDPSPALVANVAGASARWARVEALNTHTQMLNMYLATRSDASELERTSKTSRGWWVVWNRIPEREDPITAAPDEDWGRDDSDASEGRPSVETARPQEEQKPRSTASKEIFLIRKSSENSGGGLGGATLRSISAGAGGAAGGGSGWADGASRLAQGIGVDTRKYIEGLLNLSR